MVDDPSEQVDTVRRLLASLEDGAVAVDDAGDVVAVNDAALAVLAPSRSRGAVRGDAVESLLDDGLPGPGEGVELSGPEDGRVFAARTSAVDGVEGVARLVVLREVTEYRNRVERVLVLERILRHALRDEMTGVLGRAEYVRDAIEEAEVLSEAHSAADAVVEATRELTDLGDTAWAVEDVFEAGGPETVTLDLVPVVETLVERARENYGTVKLQTDLPSTATVEAPGTVETALEAVIESACERNDAPAPRVDVAVDRSPTTVAVEVADNSSGLAEDAVAMLETGEEPPLQQEGGLERWLAHWVVDAADGEIAVSENVPRGTRVTVAFPAAEK